MMKEMESDLRHGESLNFGKRRRFPLQSFIPKGKPANYYDQTRMGLGYITLSVLSDLESERPLLSHYLDSSD